MPGPDDRTLEDIARTEARFRVVNERIAASIDGGGRDRAIGFICECGDADCRRLVDLTQDEHTAIRADERHFFVVPGHELLRAESVVGRVDGRYLVVLKPPEVAGVLAAVAADAR